MFPCLPQIYVGSGGFDNVEGIVNKFCSQRGFSLLFLCQFVYSEPDTLLFLPVFHYLSQTDDDRTLVELVPLVSQ